MIRYIVSSIVLILFIWPLISKKVRKYSLIKCLMVCFGFFLVGYIFVSSSLLYLNCFTVGRTLKIMICLEGILYICYRPSLKSAINNVDYNIKNYIELIVLLLLFGMVIHLKSVPIAPLFDAGVYGSKTIDLLNGDTGTIKDLKEFTLVEGKAKEELIELQKMQAGIYPFPYSMEGNSFQYEYHGLSTWPAIMALSAKCYGLENMSKILTPIFILVCLSVYFILQNLSIKKWKRLLSVLVFGGSPLVLYLAKLPLSEMLITALVVFSLYLFTEKEPFMKVLAGVVMGAVGFSHLSLFMYMPAIFMALLVLCEIKKKKEFGIANIIVSLMLPITIKYAHNVSSLYVEGQLKKTFGYLSYNISANDIILAIDCMSIIFCIIQVLFLILPEKNVVRSTLRFLYLNHRKKFLIFILIVLGIFTIYQGYVLGFTTKLPIMDDSWRFREHYINKGWTSLIHLNIINILMATSWVVLPIVIFNMFKENREEVDVLNFVLLYSLAIYTIIRCDSPINYSSSRYFVIMIMPCIAILFGISLKSCKQGIVVGVVYLLTSIPFNITLAKTEEYYGNIQLLEDIGTVIEKDSFVLIDPKDTFLNYQLTTNLREFNNNKVFHMDSKEEILVIAGELPVYALSMNELEGAEYEKILEKNFLIVGELYSLDMIYPLKAGTANNKVYGYRIVDEMTD